MTDSYRRQEIEGVEYVLVPAEQWDEDSHDTSTPNQLWFDYILSDTSKINQDLGLYANLVLPLGSALREDDEIGSSLPKLASRALRTLLSVIWTQDDGWVPDVEVTEGWYFDIALVLVAVARSMSTDSEETAMVAFKEAADELATWLQAMLEADMGVSDAEDTEA